jgi:hypothetical protein
VASLMTCVLRTVAFWMRRWTSRWRAAIWCLFRGCRIRFGPEEADVAESMAQLCARYPDRDAYMLPVDPNRPADHELLRRIIPFAQRERGHTTVTTILPRARRVSRLRIAAAVSTSG